MTLREVHPQRLIGKNILGDEFSGGVTGFLGLNGPRGHPGLNRPTPQRRPVHDGGGRCRRGAVAGGATGAPPAPVAAMRTSGDARITATG